MTDTRPHRGGAGSPGGSTHAASRPGPAADTPAGAPADAAAEVGTAGRATLRAATPRRHWSRIVARLGYQNVALLVALALLLLVVRSGSDRVFVTQNLLDIGVAVSILGVLAVAEMVVIVSGGLDISIGSIAGLSAVSAAMVINGGGGAVPALAVGLVVGLLAGALNGGIINVLRVNPIIATLATFGAFSGIGLVLSDGRAIPARDPFFRFIGIENVLGVPVPLLILVAVALLVHLFLSRTVIGRHLYAMGSNEDAARNTGIVIWKYRLGLYMASGLAGGLAGVLLVARARLGTVAGTSTLGFTAATAALLGGAALGGGRGAITGVMLGVAILGVMDNGLVLTGTPPFYADIAIGALLVLAVAVQNSRLFEALGSRAARVPAAHSGDGAGHDGEEPR